MKVLFAAFFALLHAAVTSSSAIYPDPSAPPPPSTTHPNVTYRRTQSFLRAVSLMNLRSLRLRSARSRQKHFVNPLSTSVSARSLSMILHPDAGVCRTDISEGRLIHSAQHFVSGKAIDLAWPIKPKEIVCHSTQPDSGVAGSCALVGYPHGAWVVYPLEVKNNLPEEQQEGCSPLSALGIKFRCWDYVAVPGACVLKRS